MIFRNEMNKVFVEEIDAIDATRAKVARRGVLRDLPASEQAFWINESQTRHRPMLEAFPVYYSDYVIIDRIRILVEKSLLYDSSRKEKVLSDSN